MFEPLQDTIQGWVGDYCHQTDALKGASPAPLVWERLDQEVRQISPDAAEASVPTVIHFARFEAPFLKALHRDHRRGSDPFPFELICTHTLALQMFPDLPRRGLRAMSGYFGHVMSDLKRAGDHVIATAVVWEHEDKGDYQSLENFIDRVQISIEQISILIRVDAFRFTGKNKRELLWEAHFRLTKDQKVRTAKFDGRRD